MNIELNHGAESPEESFGLMKSQGKEIEAIIVFETLRQVIRNKAIFGPEDVIPPELSGFTSVLEKSLSRIGDDREKVYCLIRASDCYNMIHRAISAGTALKRLLLTPDSIKGMVQEAKLQIAIQALKFVTDLVIKARQAGEDIDVFITSLSEEFKDGEVDIVTKLISDSSAAQTELNSTEDEEEDDDINF